MSCDRLKKNVAQRKLITKKIPIEREEKRKRLIFMKRRTFEL